MTYSTEKAKQASGRFVLVRLTPARNVTSQLASAGGGIYTLTFSYPIAYVQRNGTTLTETTTNPPGSNDYWYHDEDTSTFKIKLASAPNTSSNVITIFYYLFYTSAETGVRAYETPSDSSTPLRPWEPRIKQAPGLRVEIDDLLVGVLSIADTQLSLVNTDDFITPYLTSYDSFYRKDADIWFCINSTDNIDRAYRGKISTLPTVDQESVSFAINDIFANLRQPAYFGDTANEALFIKSSGSFPNMDDRSSFTPCPLILGEKSRTGHKAAPGTLQSQTYYSAVIERNRAVNTNYNESGGSSVNRTWGLCRVPSEGITTQSFGTLTRIYNGGSDFSAYFSSLTNVKIGTQVKWTESGSTYWGTVVKVAAPGEEWTVAGNTYNLLVVQSFGIGVYPDSFADVTTSSVFASLKNVVITVETSDGYTTTLLQDAEFTVSETSTSGGNKYVSITMTSGWESDTTYRGAAFGHTVDGNATVRYEVWPSTTSLKHGTVLQRIATICGLSVNSTTFSDANTSLAVNCAFQVPLYDESEYGTYQDYAQRILKSTLGYMRLNASGQAEYYLLAAPSSTTETADDEYLDGLAVEVDYEDVLTGMLMRNPHNCGSYEEGLSPTPYYEASDNGARYLHEVQRTETFEHVLQTISGRAAAIFAVRSRPRIVYSFATATKHLDALIGDDLVLVSSQVLGGGGSATLKIIGLEKNTDSVAVRAAVIEGL